MHGAAERSSQEICDAARSPDLPLLREGETCWRLVRADRLSVISDAADYFRFAKRALISARRTVFLIGWDFDLRIMLDRRDPKPRAPDKLRSFLRHLILANRALRIFVLRWDLAFFEFPFRAALPLKLLDWLLGKRLDFRADRTHPLGASHHQKLVVIDDCLAFCGGIDMTERRWDTSEHRDEHPLRVTPLGLQSDPWHDATTCLDGEAAKALGELARARWLRATGERPPPGQSGVPCWPEGLGVDFHDVMVAICRTEPAYAIEGSPEQREVREIEALYLAAIREARRAIYIETQYFASHRVACAMAERLGEPDGPDIVVINPRTADGWLEETVMGAARSTLLARIRAADRHGRFRIYAPVTARRKDIYVHAKIMIVDDRFLKVGSSNLNNRSMGLDTECDLAIDAENGQADAAGIQRAIAAIRDRFLAEHLGLRPDDVQMAVTRSGGSLIGAIEALRRDKGRSLVPLQIDPPSGGEAAMADSRMLDPERPEAISEAFQRARRMPELNRLVAIGLVASSIAALLLARAVLISSRRDG